MEIKELKLFSNKINEQEDFYRNVLGFYCSRLTKSKLEIQAGSTKLILIESEKQFYYHFAFLIPNGTLDTAIDFLETHSIELLHLNEDKVIQFKSAKAIYFYDRDGNIAEFIERPNLGYSSSRDFSIDQIIKINEIGLPVSNPLQMAKKLKSKFGIIPIKNAPFYEDFCWVGDHDGVIIVVKEGRNWLPTEKQAVVNDFSIKYSEQAKDYSLSFNNNEIKDCL
tara:strand:- start:3845 stop:4513 length:669 start_codon:yes stop_codon:yes gene_type:complete